jgi:glyoxylase-like metal-dependent hydrolase (beta-lactamase superfamily II)
MPPGGLINAARVRYALCMNLAKLLAVVLVPLALVGCSGARPDASRTATSDSDKLHVESFLASEQGFYVTSALVLGKRKAVLIDAQLLISDATRLVEKIEATGRELEAVYVTHAHPDHLFGLSVLRRAFPKARFLAHPAVAAEAAAHWQAEHAQWKPVFGADLSDEPVELTPYEEPTLSLEGRPLELHGPMQADAEHLVAVYVPDADALVASDASYGNIHVWLADSKPGQWDRWLETLTKLQALEPSTVISGHHVPSHADDPADLALTAQYIRDFKSAVTASRSAQELVAAVQSKYPKHGLPIVLDLSAKAAFPPPAP